MFTIDSEFCTHKGCVREINEDAYLQRPDLGIWCVADGMGGYEAGDIASQMIVHELNSLEKQNSLASLVDTTEHALTKVNNKIQDHSEIMLGGRISGSTVVTLLIRDSVGISLWAGDSRLYVWRDNKLLQITHDHSQAQELIDSGLLLPEEVDTFPENNVITRAVGAESELKLDFVCFEIQQGDKFLLCSDGLYNAIEEEKISQLLSSITEKMPIDNQKIDLNDFIETALQNNASDNITLVCVSIN